MTKTTTTVTVNGEHDSNIVGNVEYFQIVIFFFLVVVHVLRASNARIRTTTTTKFCYFRDVLLRATC